MLNDLLKRPRHLVQRNVEHILKKMLKLFKRAFKNNLLIKGCRYDKKMSNGSPTTGVF